jgi:DNA-binding transcriptional MerR regulator
MYYTIGQVSELTDIPQSALRYWETVFDVLDPLKTPGGNRKYSEEDIRIIVRIKELLYVKGYTIKGANSQLKQDVEQEGGAGQGPLSEELKKVETVIRKSEEHINKDDVDQDTLKFIIRELKSIIRILED